MKKNINFLLMFLAAIVLSSCTQLNNQNKAIPYSVEKYISDNGTDFNDYEVSDSGVDNEYYEYERSYDVYEDIETLWLDYMTVDPGIAFDSKIIDLGVIINPDDSTIYSSDMENLPTFSEGLIYIINLKFMGIIGIPIAFKVNRLDYNNKIIEFIYLKNNIVNGFQQIFFTSAYDSEKKPVTHVEHLSFFKSGWDFQDKYIYPSFHKKTIDGFHENIFNSNSLLSIDNKKF